MDKRGLCDSNCQGKKKKYLKYRDALIFCSEGTAHIDNGTMSVHPNFNHMGPDKDNSK